MNDPSLQHAQLLLQQGRYDLAADTLRQALAVDPEDSFAHALLALCLLHQQKYDEATAEARDAILRAPDFGFAHYVLGVVMQERNRFPEAQAAAEEALRIQPGQPEFCALLAQSFLSRHRWQEALDAADRGLEADPEHTSCLNLRAIALVNLGQKQAAADTIAGALQRNPHNALSHASQGWTLLHQSKPREALEHFREALRIDPNNQWARDGTMEALKARHLLYRLMLRYYLWMSSFSRRGQWGIIIGFWVGIQLLQVVQTRYPRLTPIILPLLIAYVAFILATWLADPVFTLTLLFNRFGRYLPSGLQRIGAIAVGLLLLAAIPFLVLWLLSGFDLFLVILILLVALTLPATAIGKSPPPVRNAWIMGLYSLGVAILGAVGIVAMVLGVDAGIQCFEAALWGCLLSSIASNVLRTVIFKK
jgi:Tfp pilus assembly protein PilF